jgi:hypothetical protein
MDPSFPSARGDKVMGDVRACNWEEMRSPRDEVIEIHTRGTRYDTIEVVWELLGSTDALTAAKGAPEIVRFRVWFRVEGFGEEFANFCTRVKTTSC